MYACRCLKSVIFRTNLRAPDTNPITFLTARIEFVYDNSLATYISRRPTTGKRQKSHHDCQHQCHVALECFCNAPKSIGFHNESCNKQTAVAVTSAHCHRLPAHDSCVSALRMRTVIMTTSHPLAAASTHTFA